MRYATYISILLLVGCNSPDNSPEITAGRKANIIAWGKRLIECPTADVSVTSYTAGDSSPWTYPQTLSIVGCGIKVCCSHVYGGWSCFACKKEQWYGGGP